MFHSIATHYVGAHTQHERQIEEAQDDVHRAVRELASDLCDLATTDAGDVYQAQHAIEEEVKAVQSEVERFVAQSRQWVQGVAKIDAALRELGDVEKHAAGDDRTGNRQQGAAGKEGTGLICRQSYG